MPTIFHSKTEKTSIRHSLAKMTIAMVIAIGVNSAAFAKSETQKPANDTSLEQAIRDIELPSEEQINNMIERLPDMNALMGDMINIAKNEAMQDSFKSSAQQLKDAIKASDIMDKRDANGLPDFNALLATMMQLSTDEAVMGELRDGLAIMAQDFDDLAQKHQLGPNKTTK